MSSISERAILDALRPGSAGSLHGRWMECGFPQVVVGPKLAASLMASSISFEDASEVAEPWNTFLLLVPPGVLPGGYEEDDEVVAIWLTSLGALEQKGPEHDMKLTRSMVLEHRCGRSTVRSYLRQDWAAMVQGDIGRTLASETLPLGMKRTLDAAGKLAIGVMVELDTQPTRDSIARGAPRPSKRWGAKPKAWTFALTRDVRVDVRAEVRSWLLAQNTTRRARIVAWLAGWEDLQAQRAAERPHHGATP